MHQEGIQSVHARGYNALADFRQTIDSVEEIFSYQASGPVHVRRQLRDSNNLMVGLLARSRYLDPDRQTHPNPYAEVRQRLDHLARDTQAPAEARAEALGLSHRLGGLERHAGRLNGYLLSVPAPGYGIPLVPLAPPHPLAPLPPGIPLAPYPCPPGTEAVCSPVVPILPHHWRGPGR